MTSPKHATSDSRGRTYDVPTLGKMPSVTTIIGTKDKPALPPWSAKMAAKRAVDNAAVWQAVQQEEGDEAAIKWIAAAAREYTKQKATMGSAVHWLCENEDCVDDEQVQHKLDVYLHSMGGNYDKNRKTAYKHLEQYRRFLADYKPEYLLKEATLVNSEERYAGTADGICTIDGVMYVMDIKTGGVYDTVAMQLAAYRFATHFICDDELLPLPYNAQHGLVLQLKPESYKVYHVRCDVPDLEAFLALKRVREWSAEMEEA